MGLVAAAPLQQGTVVLQVRRGGTNLQHAATPVCFLWYCLHNSGYSATGQTGCSSTALRRRTLPFSVLRPRMGTAYVVQRLLMRSSRIRKMPLRKFQKQTDRLLPPRPPRSVPMPRRCCPPCARWRVARASPPSAPPPRDCRRAAGEPVGPGPRRQHAKRPRILYRGVVLRWPCVPYYGR